jgi:hypothetical protein
MRVINDSEFGQFLRERPLYSKILVTESFKPDLNTYTYPTDYNEKVFKFFCKKDNEFQTFKCSFYNLAGRSMGPPSVNAMISQELPPFWNTQTRMLDFTMPIEGECQMCKNKVFFLINVFSDKPFDGKQKSFPNIFMQKVGQFPAFEIRPEKEILNYLLDEDKINYSKALANLSIGYGIGAFAYFRRIIENEIKRMIKDIINLNTEHSTLLSKAYSIYEADHQMSKLISTLNQHIPNSLRDIGDNPIKLLYDQLSGGIHEFTEEECMTKAQSIDIILRYTIKKLNEEKKDISIVRGAIQNLKKG